MFSRRNFLIVAVLFLLFVILIFYKMAKEVQVAGNEITQKVFEAIELKSQSDFKMVGEKVYEGLGSEPGFNFMVTVAGSKFGVDLSSQYGQTRYVGYLDLIEQSTSTKIFSGKMLDQDNNMVDGKFKIFAQSCTLPSGDEVPLSAEIQVSDESLTGCVNETNI